MTDPITQSMIQGAAGAGGDKVYVDDLFSVDMWAGDNTTRTINNGLDLAGEGGIVFIKSTNHTSDWVVSGTGFGDTNNMSTNNNNGIISDNARFMSLQSNGFQIGGDVQVNNGNYKYKSFSFRKQKQFMDIVTFTGTGAARTIAHNLGSVPGMMIIKAKNGGRDWNVYHRSTFVGGEGEYRMRLDSDAGRQNSVTYFNNTAPTDTHFSVGTSGDFNENGTDYIAILFAHNEAVHGETGDQSLIACGTYTGTHQHNDINIGFEPSFFLVKCNSQSGQSWTVVDTIHAYGKNNSSGDHPTDAKTNYMNTNASMTTTNARISQIPNGIRILSESQGFINESGQTYIYLAVRSAVGLVAKPPTAGTDVFFTGTANNSTGPCPPGSFNPGIEVDFILNRRRSYNENWLAATRKSGTYYWQTNDTASNLQRSAFEWDSSTGFGHSINGIESAWMWKRSRGFDVQANYSAGSGTFNHNLGQVPEMIWAGNLLQNDWNGVGHHKLRTTDPWNYVAYMNNDSAGNSGSGYWNNTAPTATQYTLGNNTAMSSGQIMVCLWCSVPGICKIDDYNGDGGTTNAVNCGFQPRYVMIKRVDSSGDWKIWDYSRGNNVLRLNLTNGQVNDVLVSFTSTGFTLISPDGTVNASGGRYIYHAQA